MDRGPAVARATVSYLAAWRRIWWDDHRPTSCGGAVCKTKEDAKRRIDVLIPASHPSVEDAVLLLYKRRAKDLIDNPDVLNQDGFGVCGMASVLRMMLRYDLPAF